MIIHDKHPTYWVNCGSKNPMFLTNRYVWNRHLEGPPSSLAGISPVPLRQHACLLNLATRKSVEVEKSWVKWNSKNKKHGQFRFQVAPSPNSPNISSPNMGVSINGDTPIAGWFTVENPIKVDDFWGYSYFRKPLYVLFLLKDPRLFDPKIRPWPIEGRLGPAWHCPPRDPRRSPRCYWQT